MSTTTLSDIMTFDAAARALHAEGCKISRDLVGEIAFKHEIAIPWNITTRPKRESVTGRRSKHWRVRLADLREAILKERTSPAKEKRQRPSRRMRTAGLKPLHPRVTC